VGQRGLLLAAICIAVLALSVSLMVYSAVGGLGEVVESLSSDVKRLSAEIGRLSRGVEALSARLESVERPFPARVIDALGRVVVVPSEPRRIVSMAPSVTEILFALGLGERVVGVTSYCNYPPEVPRLVKEGRIAVIGGFTNPSVEKIVALSPDLVIGLKIHERLVPILESLGVRVLIVGSDTVDDVYRAILTIGAATGTLDTATELVERIQGSIREVWMAVANASRPKVLVVVWLTPLWVAGQKTYISDLISFAGGENAFKGEGWAQISPEELMAANPDVIIITGHAAPGKSPDEIIEYLAKAVPGWSNISAVAAGRIYFFMETAEDALVRPGPRIALVVKVLAMILHPEIYGVEVKHVVTSVEEVIRVAA